MNDSPYQVGVRDDGTASRRPLSCFAVVLCGVAILVLLVMFLMPFRRSASPGSLRTQSLNNIRNLSIAVQNYAVAHRGLMPPAYTVDAEGNRLHSWRVLLLPYLDQQALFDRIDLSKPWDHPDNAELADPMPWVYAAPDDQGSLRTSYVALTGPDAAFNETPRELQSFGGPTLILTEVPDADRVHWMQPDDGGVEFLLGMPQRSDLPHRGAVCVARHDGACQTLSQDIDRQTLEQLISVSGPKESVPD